MKPRRNAFVLFGLGFLFTLPGIWLGWRIASIFVFGARIEAQVIEAKYVVRQKRGNSYWSTIVEFASTEQQIIRRKVKVPVTRQEPIAGGTYTIHCESSLQQCEVGDSMFFVLIPLYLLTTSMFWIGGIVELRSRAKKC